jgi:hypothetical protein
MDAAGGAVRHRLARLVAAATKLVHRPSPSGRLPRVGPTASMPGILSTGEVAERLMAALLKSAESKDFVGSNPTLSARS